MIALHWIRQRKVKRKEQHTVENALHIDVEDIVPSLLFREIEERSSPGDARIVHKNVEFAFAFPELSNECVASCF